MSEKILQQILTEVASLKNEMSGMKNEQLSMKAQLEENTQLTKAIFNRQEETDAKLDNLSTEVHNIRGELTFVKEELKDIKNDLTFTYQKTSKSAPLCYK